MATGMKRVQPDASLSDQAVRAAAARVAANGSADPGLPSRARRRRSPVPAPVDVLQVDSAVMTAALAVAAGDRSRLRLNRDGSVTVLNRGKGS